MTADDIATASRAHGLSKHTEAILRSARPSIHLHPSPIPLERLPLGASRLGGVPDLPQAAPWPEWQGTPLSFISQCNLADLSAFPAAASLPSDGHLAFFYHAEQKTWGFDPEDRGSWRVMYYPRETPLLRIDTPAGVAHEGRYQACSLNFEELLTIPPPDSTDFAAFQLSKKEREQYYDLYETIVQPEGLASSWLLGHPEQIQGDMQAECALVTGGVYAGDPSGWKDPRRPELERNAPFWQLLLQVGSEEAAGMMWGDGGCIYYWIQQRDLAAREFESSWLILQCS